jgi:hypothetical protein
MCDVHPSTIATIWSYCYISQTGNMITNWHPGMLYHVLLHFRQQRVSTFTAPSCKKRSKIMRLSRLLWARTEGFWRNEDDLVIWRNASKIVLVINKANMYMCIYCPKFYFAFRNTPQKTHKPSIPIRWISPVLKLPGTAPINKPRRLVRLAIPWAMSQNIPTEWLVVTCREFVDVFPDQITYITCYPYMSLCILSPFWLVFYLHVAWLNHKIPLNHH